MIIEQKIKQAFGDFDVVTFLEEHNVKYDEWLKSQIFQLLETVEKDVLKILEDETQFLSEQGLLEYLASLEHKQWSHWTRDFLEFDNPSNRKRWRRQAHSPYNKLTEKEKESDREWARKVLEILKVQFLFEKLRWEEQEKQKLRELADLIKKIEPRDNQLENPYYFQLILTREEKQKFVEVFGVEVATALAHQNEGSGSLNGQEAEDEGAIPSSSDLGVESAKKEKDKP